MPSPSKNKGNKFENDMCKVFNRIYETEEFARTPNSGAIMGRTNWGRKQGLAEDVKRTLGSDIIVPDWFKFAVECKHYKDSPSYDKLIKAPGDKTLDGWLGEAMYDAINLNLHPMLVFKTNNKGVHVVLPSYFRSELDGLEFYAKYREFIIIGLAEFEERSRKIAEAAQLYEDGPLYKALIETESVQTLLDNLK